MLAWIAEKLKPADTSLAAAAGIRKFLDHLAASRPHHALDDIGERFAGAAELELDAADCRRLLKRIDEAAQAPLGELWNSVFSDGPGTSIFDTHWRALANYQRNVYSGYAYCLQQLPLPDRADETERQDALLLANRAMAALVAHKALMRIRYRDPHPAFWSDAHALFALVRSYDLAHAPARLYPASIQQTTVEREYITALLLDAAPTGNLLPAQTLCLHLILQHFSEHYRLADSFTPQKPFYIDLAKNKPPQRWLVGLKPRPEMCFFGFPHAVNRLGALREVTQARRVPPKWVQKSRIDADRFLALLDMLLEHWSETPPQRRGRRDRQVAAILATHGFAQVHRMIAYSRFAKEGRQLDYAASSAQDLVTFSVLKSVPVDAPGQPAAPDRPATPMEVLQRFEHAGDSEMIERWSVVDMSEGGLGAVAQRHHGWLRAGMLVGFRYHDCIDWRLAIVRRLSRTAQGQLGVGLECQAETVGCARLKLENSPETAVWVAAGSNGDMHADAILVGGERPLLIAAPGTYAADRECAMSIEKRTTRIRFLGLTERGYDYECISFSSSTPD